MKITKKKTTSKTTSKNPNYNDSTEKDAIVIAPHIDKKTGKFIPNKYSEVPAKWYDEYEDLYSFRTVPICDEIVERLAQEYLIWAENTPEAIRIGQFSRHKGIPLTTFQAWTQKYAPIKKAHIEVLEILAQRREHGALTHLYNAQTALKALPMYDEQWKKNMEWEASLRKDTYGNNEPSVIVLSELEFNKTKETI